MTKTEYAARVLVRAAWDEAVGAGRTQGGTRAPAMALEAMAAAVATALRAHGIDAAVQIEVRRRQR